MPGSRRMFRADRSQKTRRPPRRFSRQNTSSLALNLLFYTQSLSRHCMKPIGLFFSSLFAAALFPAFLASADDLDLSSFIAADIGSPALAGTSSPAPGGVDIVAGGGSTLQGSFPVNYPQNWLRLQRAGDVFNGYASWDGRNWSMLGSVSLSITNPLYFGLTASSHTTNRTTTARFRDLSFVTNG